VEADEVTYNLHVMLRYEIEKKIFNEDFPLNQLPELWNSMITEWFGITVPNDTLGCLQDIHWSMAAFGYFPTYTLGNLYAAQLLEAMDSDIGSINQHISSGDWSEMLEWLRNRIHKRGSALLPASKKQQALLLHLRRSCDMSKRNMERFTLSDYSSSLFAEDEPTSLLMRSVNSVIASPRSLLRSSS
ncbi:hypothetical protein N9V76_05570, partial [Candidatus Poseidoniales archaeon]|nr:hypothetical protein [Candidatus Poseidoniales archaeon]